MSQFNRRTSLRALIAGAAFLTFEDRIMASEGCCAHCGSGVGNCRKVCRLVREDRKVTKTCWGMQSEDFCVGDPSTPECRKSEQVCGPDGADPKVCSEPHVLGWTIWRPGCGAEMFTKRKLMKRTVTKTVPGFKWVVEDVCKACHAGLQLVEVPRGTRIPEPPVVRGAEIIAGRESHTTTETLKRTTTESAGSRAAS